MFFHWSWAFVVHWDLADILYMFGAMSGPILAQTSFGYTLGYTLGYTFWPWTTMAALGTSRNDNNKLAMRMTTSANKHFRYFGPDRGFDDECLKADVCWAVTENSYKKQQINNFQQVSTSNSKNKWIPNQQYQ